MNFFETVEARRSIRKFTDEKVPAEVIEKALKAAILAPNSSNIQAWDFYWVVSQDKKQALVKSCLSQSAARTAAELVVIVADPKKWKRSQPEIVKFVESVKAPNLVKMYYTKLIPFAYSWGFLNTLGYFKWLVVAVTGLFRPITRGPNFKKDVEEVVIKSAALAAENFVLAISAQGFASCMMEGFDEVRVKRVLKLSRSARIVMVIAVGREGERGTWGPRFRIPDEWVIHKV